MRHLVIKRKIVAVDIKEILGIGDSGNWCGAFDREEDEKGRKLEREDMGKRGNETV